jgi:hypothetical protein
MIVVTSKGKSVSGSGLRIMVLDVTDRGISKRDYLSGHWSGSDVRGDSRAYEEAQYENRSIFLRANSDRRG